MNKTMMQKITPHLWFDNNAEEAAILHLYFQKLKNHRYCPLRRISCRGLWKTKGDDNDSVTFELEGQRFMALNGGPVFKFSPAISFFVNCQTQEEVDDLWDKLSEGGEKEQCGWLKDKFGVSWQIVPNVLGEMLQDKDVKKSESHGGNASNEEN